GVGTVSLDGSRQVRVYNDTTFTLTARNGNKTDTCTVTVRVDDEPVQPSNPVCDSFTASPTRVTDGAYTTLSWDTTNATSVSINNGVGSVALDGSRQVRIYDDTTFTLTARGGNKTDTCTVEVTVKDEPTEPNHPVCDSFTASPTRVDEG